MDGGGVGVLLLLGLAVFGGMLGAWVFQRLHVPQVVGYIAIGVLVGQSGLGLIRPEDIAALRPLNLFALGIIGFLVGGEIHMSTLRQYARQFTAILLGEGLLSFGLVGGVSYVLLWHALHDVAAAAAGAVVLGAIASATDPASTMDVLWEYRARGVLTTSIVAIVALDDALAMLLYGLGTSAAQLLTGGHASIARELGVVSLKLAGAVVVGSAAAVILGQFLKWSGKPERALSLAIGMLLLTIGVAALVDMDVILASMTMGLVLANRAPRRSRELFETVRGFSVPIYVLFFVLVGARLGIKEMPPWLWGVVIAYVLCRGVGKVAGAALGAVLTRGDPLVRKYLGMSLFAQGGVAVGLSIMASHRLSGIEVTAGMSLGDMIIFVITATTLIVQVSGPPMVKWAVMRSGEAGRNVTEDDILDELTVEAVMDPVVITFREEDNLRRIIEVFAENDQMLYPVLDRERRICGMISAEEIRGVLAEQGAWDWILADDLMVDSGEEMPRRLPLRQAVQYMRDFQADYVAVVESAEDPRPVGMLRMHELRRRIATELLRRHGALVGPAPV
jgi:Kef-type K+ transport system membrane component KefB/predicted transcriptional regulator